MSTVWEYIIELVACLIIILGLVYLGIIITSEPNRDAEARFVAENPPERSIQVGGKHAK